MKILWHKRAVAQLYQVEEYVLRDFGERIRQEFMDEVEQVVLSLAETPTLVSVTSSNQVEQVVLSLAETPTMGKIDPLFAHRKQTYRSIIVRRKNKIVYYIKDDTINIAAFWDTRREPKNQARQTK